MHVVIKRRGMSLRAVWDGVAKPTAKQASHWVRFTPEQPRINDQFIVEPSITVLTDDLAEKKQTISTVVSNVENVKLSSPLVGTYDLSAYDFGTDASMTRTSYSAHFIAALLGETSLPAPNSTSAANWSSSSLRLTPNEANTTLSAIDTAGFKPVGLRLNYNAANKDDATLLTVGYHYTRMQLDHHMASITPNALTPSNEYNDDVYLLKATLPDHALLEKDDLSQYRSVAETDDSVMTVNLDPSSVVPDFFVAARAKPTMFYTGDQATAGDGHSRRVGMPTLRLKQEHRRLSVTSIDQDYIFQF
tara:strand:+ start:210136 stop:211047 length:912 start_codon:yes stop_codon:yes gene_type:complete